MTKESKRDDVISPIARGITVEFGEAVANLLRPIHALLLVLVTIESVCTILCILLLPRSIYFNSLVWSGYDASTALAWTHVVSPTRDTVELLLDCSLKPVINTLSSIFFVFLASAILQIVPFVAALCFNKFVRKRAYEYVENNLSLKERRELENETDSYEYVNFSNGIQEKLRETRVFCTLFIPLVHRVFGIAACIVLTINVNILSDAMHTLPVQYAGSVFYIKSEINYMLDEDFGNEVMIAEEMLNAQ